jgi:hypothetical protein
LLAACAKDPVLRVDNEGTAPRADPGPKDWPHGCASSGNHIEDAAGSTVVLRGVNRSATGVLACVAERRSLPDGPSSEVVPPAIKAWPNSQHGAHPPLNESCWLGINGVPDRVAGPLHKTPSTTTC